MRKGQGMRACMRLVQRRKPAALIDQPYIGSSLQSTLPCAINRSGGLQPGACDAEHLCCLQKIQILGQGCIHACSSCSAVPYVKHGQHVRRAVLQGGRRSGREAAPKRGWQEDSGTTLPAAR